jgi:hypothetical protein
VFFLAIVDLSSIPKADYKNRDAFLTKTVIQIVYFKRGEGEINLLCPAIDILHRSKGFHTGSNNYKATPPRRSLPDWHLGSVDTIPK